MRDNSVVPIGRSANSLCKTQSNPFCFGDLAHPGRPTTGTSAMRAMSRRLPGSTGMPKCISSPPQRTMAVGTTSFLSDDRRCAEDEDQLASVFHAGGDRARDRVLIVSALFVSGDSAAERVDSMG